jgi:heme/copper-type cytochrome/quinol oxidase subunit 2
MRSRFILLLLLLAGLVVAFAPLPVPPITPQERMLRPGSAQVFEIDAGQFAYSPSEIHVNPGDTVTFQLISTDVAHGLYVDGYDVSVEAHPGQSATLTFTADKPGSFRFRCNVTCGAMHPFMIGRLVVGSNEWLFRSLGLALLASIGLLLFPRLQLKTDH